MCDGLAKVGFVATCNSEGADNGNGNKWTADLNAHFTGRHVYIIPDNDAQGRTHAQHVAGRLDPVAASVRIVELPDLPLKGDVSDWLKRDSAGARLAKLAKESPQWEPGAGKTTAAISRAPSGRSSNSRDCPSSNMPFVANAWQRI